MNAAILLAVPRSWDNLTKTWLKSPDVFSPPALKKTGWPARLAMAAAAAGGESSQVLVELIVLHPTQGSI